MLMIDLRIFILTVTILIVFLSSVFYFLSDDERINIFELFFVGIIVFLGKLIIGDWMDFLLILYVFIRQKYIKKTDNNFLINVKKWAEEHLELSYVQPVVHGLRLDAE